MIFFFSKINCYKDERVCKAILYKTKIIILCYTPAHDNNYLSDTYEDLLIVFKHYATVTAKYQRNYYTYINIFYRVNCDALWRERIWRREKQTKEKFVLAAKVIAK